MAEPSPPSWTVARLLAWTKDYFARQKLESPRLCAEILLAHALGCERLALYTRFETVPDETAVAAFRESVKHAAAGKPIAYLTGTKDFFSLNFDVTAAVLVPRPETEVLVERTIQLVRQQGTSAARILDIGTGSGCIAIALAKQLPDAALFASDVSEAALEIARRNAKKHEVEARVEFRQGDLFEAWPGETFDVIVSNPPYIGRREAASLPKNVRDHEPHAALFAGDDGLDVLRRLSAAAPQFLRPEGHLLMEMAFDQSPAVRGLLEADGYRDIVTYRDGLRHERVVHGRFARVPQSCAGT